MKFLLEKINKLKKKKLAKKLYPNLDRYIIDLFFENYGYAMPLSLLNKLNEICRAIKPKLIFEFGSGVSTILLSSCLKNTEGEIFTFDESLEWIRNTYRKYPDINNVCFIFASSSKKINYQIFTRNININKKVDLLIIDGPSGDRFTEPAKQLYDRLISSDTICVVDDTDREINDIAAKELAEAHQLRKIDYRDPFYAKHKYSILYPQSMKNKHDKTKNKNYC